MVCDVFFLDLPDQSRPGGHLTFHFLGGGHGGQACVERGAAAAGCSCVADGVGIDHGR